MGAPNHAVKGMNKNSYVLGNENKEKNFQFSYFEIGANSDVAIIKSMHFYINLYMCGISGFCMYDVKHYSALRGHGHCGEQSQ